MDIANIYVNVAITNLYNLKDIDIFLQIINKYPSKFYLEHDNYRVNAKSVLGIMSLDLSNDLKLICDCGTPEREIIEVQTELKNNNLCVKGE